jgi:hypothetical protein
MKHLLLAFALGFSACYSRSLSSNPVAQVEIPQDEIEIIFIQDTLALRAER